MKTLWYQKYNNFNAQILALLNPLWWIKVLITATGNWSLDCQHSQNITDIVQHSVIQGFQNSFIRRYLCRVFFALSQKNQIELSWGVNTWLTVVSDNVVHSVSHSCEHSQKDCLVSIHAHFHSDFLFSTSESSFCYFYLFVFVFTQSKLGCKLRCPHFEKLLVEHIRHSQKRRYGDIQRDFESR